METAQHDAVEMQGQALTSHSQPINYVSRPKQKNKVQPKTFPPCPSCGKTNYGRSDCFHKESTCNFCHKRGHLASVCRFKARTNPKHSQTRPFSRKPRSAHDLSEDEPEAQHHFTLPLNKVSNGTRKIMVNVNLDSVPVKMELDTGSALSLMTIKDYKEIFVYRPSLASTRVKLKTYTGEIIHPLGKTVVHITTPTQNTKQDLHILEKGSNPIFGRDWLSQVKINWEGLHQQIHKVGLDAKSNTATLKEKFKDLL
ncbi:hypothetical protein ElyMa_002758400 [Elysia marginata]|uniref:Peptidase A2 domain-containing protein n=1 Tax=Elysia marginata TaxID=1093978 RepID=A0AAV4HJU7_9GAST|nr:hypothetical protein ElyMa_002758400 [Elysia marginata]